MYYFAYGSNMLRKRLEERLGKVEDLGMVLLYDYKIAFNKKSSDGTGKTNIIPLSGQNVSGVAFSLTTDQLGILDKAEGGYNRTTISAMLNNVLTNMETYVAKETRIDNSLLPTKKYRQYLIDGALEHFFPQDYVEMLNNLQTID